MKQYRKMWSEVNTARLHVMGSNDWDYIREHTSLSDGLFSLLGLQETSSNDPRFLTQTKIPYECEVKNCHWTMQGHTNKALPNLILHHKNKNWRVRAELLLFKEDKLFLYKKDKMNQYGTYYNIPGGGIDDPKEYIESAAARECEEECLIIPKNVRYTGVTVSKVYDKKPAWHAVTLNRDGIYYDGSISFICTGEYDKKYTKYVKKMDQDVMKNGSFYSYDEVKDLLSKEHKKIFEDYLNKK
jgi:ADP-ribose pyrophosphatase YjhB (NUDIX family)